MFSVIVTNIGGVGNLYKQYKWVFPVKTRHSYNQLRPGIATHRHTAHYGQTWRLPYNRKYIAYRNTARVGPSHGHTGSAQKLSWRLVQRFQRYAHGQTDTQTDRQADRNTLLSCRGGVILKFAVCNRILKTSQLLIPTLSCRAVFH